MNAKLSVLVITPLLLAVALGLGTGTRQAEANHGGAHSLSAVAQQCLPDGTLIVRFTWQPSGLGSQWFDISRLANNFAFGFDNAGPLPPGAFTIDWHLHGGTNYYARVNTLTPFGWIPSATLAFQTGFCPVGFTPPHSLIVTVLSGTSARFDWQRGIGNFFFCLDTAHTVPELVNLVGSWRNWGCGTTATTLTITGLACGTNYVARVWAAGSFTSGYTNIVSFRTHDCPVSFTPPSNLRSQVLGPTAVRLAWDRGDDNHWFCVDLATSRSDLLNFSGSFFNRACGITSTVVEIHNLACDTTYFWRVFAVGTYSAGHSPVASFTTGACPAPSFTPPTNLTSTAITQTSATLSWTRGTDNQWFCVDLAKSEDDLRNMGATWFNRGCGTTGTSLNVTGLDCGTTYYWRVFAVGTVTHGYSRIATFTTAACPSS